MADEVDDQAVAIGRAVRGAIAMAGLTLAEVSAQTGIHMSTLSRRVNGSLAFTLPELLRVAELCGMRLSELALEAERIYERRTGLRPAKADNVPEASATDATDAADAPDDDPDTGAA